MRGCTCNVASVRIYTSCRVPDDRQGRRTHQRGQWAHITTSLPPSPFPIPSSVPKENQPTLAARARSIKIPPQPKPKPALRQFPIIPDHPIPSYSLNSLSVHIDGLVKVTNPSRPSRSPTSKPPKPPKPAKPVNQHAPSQEPQRKCKLRVCVCV